jgi:hypothetical protein
MSLRTRLALAFAVTAALATSLVGVFVYLGTADDLRNRRATRVTCTNRASGSRRNSPRVVGPHTLRLSRCVASLHGSSRWPRS